MNQRIECKIKGRVQGVMFRDFVQRGATEMDIVGYVENSSDGAVRVIAEGEEESLKKLEELFYKKPFVSRIVARVDEVETKWKSATGEFDKFTIKY